MDYDMKTHTIKTPTAELLIVEIPRVCDYKLTDEMIFIMDIEKSSSKRIKGSYTLLGKPDEIREEDARELVELPIDKWGDDKFKFLDYCHDGHYDLFTAKESLLSLIESEIYWNVNPIKKPNGENYYYEENHGFDGVETLWDGGSYNEDLSIFEEAEQKTFDRNRSVIFKKNK